MLNRATKKTWLMGLMACLLVVPLVLAACAAPEETETPTPTQTQTPAEVYTWRLQGMQPAPDERQQVQEHMAEELNTMTQGMINIDIYTTGTLVPIEEVPESLAKGVIDMAHVCSGYYAGINPVFLCPPGMQDFREQWQADTLMWDRGGNEIIRAAYAELGVYDIGAIKSTGPEIIYSTVPIRHVEDYQGLKIRSYGQFAKYFDALGASTVYLPGDEIVPALSTGAIDAAEWSSFQSNYMVGFHDVTDYQIWPPFIWANAGCEILMGLDLWNSLPPHLQMMLEVVVREGNDWVDRRYQKNDALYAQKMLDEGPMEEIWIPEDEWPQLVGAAEQVRDELAAASPESAQMIELTREYMRELGYLE